MSRPDPTPGEATGGQKDPTGWEQRFQDWDQIGQQYRDYIPDHKALTDSELKFLESHGFEFTDKLGEGGYGTVWRCTASKLVPGQTLTLACKVLNIENYKEHRRTLHRAVTKMVTEAKIWEALEHRNIVKVHHVVYVQDKETLFPYVRVLIFMELCKEDLNSLLEKKPMPKTFTEDEARPVMADVCQGVKYMHDNNVMHLDIKPRNILLGTDAEGKDCYKLTDFGFAKRFDPGVIPAVGRIGGTEGYAAPELSQKSASDARRADIYSLGMTLLFMLVSKQLFVGCQKELQMLGPMGMFQMRKQYGFSLPAYELVRKMTQNSYQYRPFIEQVVTDYWLTGVAQPRTTTTS